MLTAHEVPCSRTALSHLTLHPMPCTVSQVLSVEDAKSEIVKIFQEAWEKEHGFEWEDQGPAVQRYAEDILRS